jgi:hypothetical protein
MHLFVSSAGTARSTSSHRVRVDPTPTGVSKTIGWVTRPETLILSH